MSAVILTAAGKFVFMDYLNWRFAFAAAVIAAWSVYIIFRYRSEKDILKYWGFRMDNFTLVVRKILPVGVLSVVAFFAIGFYQNTINITWHIIPILLLYPIWGVIQQFLLIALMVGNMSDLKGEHLNNWAIILFSALLFSSIHYPFVWLMVGTFFLAIFYGFIYLRGKNIYALGLFHGWLAGLFYYTVVGRDPFLEMFNKIFHLSN
jgi:membrane protease YdiL (CAAX protease family)